MSEEEEFAGLLELLVGHLVMLVTCCAIKKYPEIACSEGIIGLND